MIARIWNGRTSKTNYAPYSEFLIRVAVPDYTDTQGFISLSFLRTIVGEEAHFRLIKYWEDI